MDVWYRHSQDNIDTKQNSRLSQVVLKILPLNGLDDHDTLSSTNENRETSSLVGSTVRVIQIVLTCKGQKNPITAMIYLPKRSL